MLLLLFCFGGSYKSPVIVIYDAKSFVVIKILSVGDEISEWLAMQ